MNINILKNFIIAFLLTEITEEVVALYLGIKKKESLLDIFFVNLLTNPLVNFIWLLLTMFVFYNFSYDSVKVLFYIILEAIVIITEAFIFYKMKTTKEIFDKKNYKQKSFLFYNIKFSLLLNLCSIIIGLILLK